MSAAVPGDPLPRRLAADAKGPAADAKSPDHEAAAPALWRFWGPRYWPTWLLLAWLELAAALPWRVTIAIHEQLGRVLWWLMRRRRKIVVRNLEICFPELDAEAVQALAKRHFESLGVCLGEIGFGWFGSPERLAPLFRVEGLEHLAGGARARQRRGAVLRATSRRSRSARR